MSLGIMMTKTRYLTGPNGSRPMPFLTGSKVLVCKLTTNRGVGSTLNLVVQTVNTNIDINAKYVVFFYLL